MIVVVSYVAAYSNIILNDWNEEASDAFPSINKVITEEISLTLLVNGAAIEASASDKLIPASAYFKATQSFAPSPHIPTLV
jgi:hypothetical protein